MSRDFTIPSTWHDADALHVAIIMDGNGRWAAHRGLSRTTGHLAGVRTVRRVVETAPSLGIGVLTLYAFSADNWRRPADEVGALMQLLKRYLDEETQRCVKNGVRLNIIGRRDRLNLHLQEAITRAEDATAGSGRLLLRVAVDYSSRWAIIQASHRVNGHEDADAPTLERALLSAVHSIPGVPAVDLLIRTSGEQRLSDFMLWECAYAELHFTPVLWPDFQRSDLEEAVRDFRARERRFGALPGTGNDGRPPASIHTTQGGTR